MTEEELVKLRDRCLELFRYEEGKLIRIKYMSSNAKVGDIAGSLKPDGRYTILIDRKRHRLHRIIYLMIKKEWVTCIDHIDRNPSNNKIENLRPSCPSTNQWNKDKYANNTSGYKGVYPLRGKWTSSIQTKNKRIHLGTFNSPEEASEAYKKASLELHGEFSNYSK